MSTFLADGYRDAKNGLPASPPAEHPQTNVYTIEYMEGYEDGCEEMQAGKLK